MCIFQKVQFVVEPQPSRARLKIRENYRAANNQAEARTRRETKAKKIKLKRVAE